MKTLRIALCGLLLAGALSLTNLPDSKAQIIAAPIPNLKIISISENGNLSWVQVKNVGTGNAGACHLRMWYLNNGSWLTNDMSLLKPVPALAPGATTVIIFNHAGVAAAFNCYKVDANNVVSESKEADNTVYIPYGPAG